MPLPIHDVATPNIPCLFFNFLFVISYYCYLGNNIRHNWDDTFLGIVNIGGDHDVWRVVPDDPND